MVILEDQNHVMFRSFPTPAFFLLLVVFFSCSGPQGPATAVKLRSYEDLVTLFGEWRKFQTPFFREGIPDYSAGAMKVQQNDLVLWQNRLANIDTSGWPISQQVDWVLVWAEMNGLGFEHRVTKPWSRDPAFYVWFYLHPSDVPEREGPTIAGAIEMPSYQMPLTRESAAEISMRLKKASALYTQARSNLVGNARDLWRLGIRSIRSQSEELTLFANTVSKEHPELSAAALEAKRASDEFAAWLEKQAPLKTEISGVGKENYSWYIRNVHLMPYDWDGYRQLLERELARSHAALRLTEHRNRSLPKLVQISNETQYDSVMTRGVREFMSFLSDNGIMTVKDYMEPAMMEQVGKFSPATGLRGFFAEVDYRDPMPMRSHHFHWIDKAMSRVEPVASPIRRVPTLYNIFDSRAEGMATAMEELMWQVGLYQSRPRAEELVWIMLAQRAARGLGGIYQHAREMDFDSATKYASKWVPWGLLPADGGTIQGEEHFYLQQPGYETSYVSGKLQIDKLIAEYARQREGSFVLKDFFDEFLSKGIIPMSLIYWEMTGDRSMLDEALKPS
jgi:hypothetical protein